ncbi:MAG: hypothetical protein ABI672_17145, partial [Vicinamibacteria bacterium]
MAPKRKSVQVARSERESLGFVAEGRSSNCPLASKSKGRRAEWSLPGPAPLSTDAPAKAPGRSLHL